PGPTSDAYLARQVPGWRPLAGLSQPAVRHQHIKARHRLEDEPDGETDHGADQNLEGRMSKKLAKPCLLHPPHVEKVLDQAIEHLGLAARGAAQARSVVHDHEREDK